MSTGAVVHLVDDDEAVRSATALLLNALGFPTRVYDSAVSFLQAVENVQPGCILSDVQMPGMDGLELQRRLRVLGIQLPLILMTGHADVPLAVEAMKAGAVDFIEKPFGEAVLVRAIEAALSRYDEQERRSSAVCGAKARLALLSPREREVLRGLIDGQPNKIIAHALGLSPRTVEVYRANLMAKMGVSSLPELIRVALLAEPAAMPPQTATIPRPSGRPDF